MSSCCFLLCLLEQLPQEEQQSRVHTERHQHDERMATHDADLHETESQLENGGVTGCMSEGRHIQVCRPEPNTQSQRQARAEADSDMPGCKSWQVPSAAARGGRTQFHMLHRMMPQTLMNMPNQTQRGGSRRSSTCTYACGRIQAIRLIICTCNHHQGHWLSFLKML